MSRAQPAPKHDQDLALLAQRARQFLVHSFLYYRLGEPIVPDKTFDKLAAELRALRQAHPQAPMPYAEVLDKVLGPEESGFQIREYPPEIISTAFKLLYATSSPQEDFVEFVERRGYRASLPGAEPQA